MSINVSTPWHKISFSAFLNERLPDLLAGRLPVVGYEVTERGVYACSVTLTLAGNGDDVVVVYADLPQPDARGVFQLGENAKVVVPIADHERLDTATVQCVGEQLYDFIAERLGQSSADLPWNEALARAWLPLDGWIADFLDDTAQRLDETNWLSVHTHLRTLLIPTREEVIAAGQLGRVCPFETPEGPNIGRVLRIAVGAEIRDDKIVVVDDQPAATLGLSTSMIPFLEHDDPNRILMGANMLRQWIPQMESEPALVQTGNEPDDASFWYGRNLLTAYVSWGAGTYEDGIIVSESCASRFDSPYSLQVGDKLSNRHGTKGVVSQILPDSDMPHLSDGTPVDLVFNFANLHRRMNFGQIREAVMGRIARVAGRPAIVPPFAAPDADALRVRLREVGLPESGMETLTQGKHGSRLEQASTVGWVYWGRLFHLAKDKLHTFVAGEWGQVQGEMENFMLRDLGAFENIRENLNTRSVRRPDAKTLITSVAAGPVEQAGTPTPMFYDLVQRLRVAGIVVELADDDKLHFSFASPNPEHVQLAQPVPHPWFNERFLVELGASASLDLVGDTEYAALLEANDRLARMLAGKTPEKLISDARTQLEQRVRVFFDELLTPVHLRLSERLNFSARAVLVPATMGLTLEQVGLPEDMAWSLFGPLVMHELGGDVVAVSARNERAMQALDAVMAQSWIILNRAPTFAPTALIAFHPVRMPGYAIHLHPLVCKWLNADFDGDQAAIMLPITAVAQQEAGEKLSVAAHLTRDPGLLADLLPSLDMLWGLSKLSLSPEGLAELESIVGEVILTTSGFITQTTLVDAMRKVLAHESVPATLTILERLMQQGLAMVQASGASLSPFAGMAMALPVPVPPSTDDVDVWSLYPEAVEETLAASNAYADMDLGPQLLMVKARGLGLKPLSMLVAGRGVVRDVANTAVISCHGYVEGYTPEEMFACVAGARRGLTEVWRGWELMGRTFRERNVSRSFNVLTRALRAKHPGLVFARAAANEEVDPLMDVEVRLLVGVPV